MIKNQNTLATLMILLRQLKPLMKSFKQERQTFKTADLNFLAKKISNKQFHHCEANIFLEKVKFF